MATVDSLNQLAGELLAVAASAVASTDAGAAAATYLSPGIPSLDRECDTVAVWVAAIGQENTLPRSPSVGQRLRFGWINLVTFNVLAARCLGYGKAVPSVAVMNAAAAKVQQDGWALWNAIPAAVIDNDLFGGICRDVKVLPIQPLTPQGNMGGWTLTVQAGLDGYTP